MRERNKTNEEGRWPVERRDICDCVVCDGEIRGWWVTVNSLSLSLSLSLSQVSFKTSIMHVFVCSICYFVVL